jgi:photosystem II stability/assembly factor-like uncharacterized protein
MLKYLAIVFVLVSLSFAEGRWVVQPNPLDTADVTFSDVCFIDSMTGWVVRGNGDPVLHTTDGGKTWRLTNLKFTLNPQSGYLNAPVSGGITGVDTLHWWTVGAYSKILHSQDGGQTWQQQDAGSTGYCGLTDVSFVDTLHGWICGMRYSDSKGIILHTNDGGANWQLQESGVNLALNSVFFLDSLKGFIVGTRLILSSVDGGQHWQKQDSGTYNGFTDVVFCDSLHGLMVGGGGTILRTVDGGKTWSAETTEYISGPFWDVAMPDSFHNWAVSHGQAILYTDDGGANWLRQTSPIDQTLYGVSFPDTAYGWAVGEYGKIIHYTTSQGIEERNTCREIAGGNLQFYPNPASEGLHIKYQITGKGQQVELKIFSVTGQVVQVFTIGEKHQGLYTVQWNMRNDSGKEVSPGVYFIQLKTDKGSAIKKVVLLK